MQTVIVIKKCVIGFTLKDELWDKSLDTMWVIMNNNKEEEFMRLLKKLYPEPVDILEIHNFMWFDSDYIYEQLEIEAD